jgi:hypothetical protein
VVRVLSHTLPWPYHLIYSVSLCIRNSVRGMTLIHLTASGVMSQCNDTPEALLFPSWIGFVEYAGVYAKRTGSVSGLAGARAEGARWEPRVLYAKGYQLSTQDSEDSTTRRTFYKVWWSAKQSSGTRPIEARRSAFHDTSNQYIPRVKRRYLIHIRPSRRIYKADRHLVTLGSAMSAQFA